MPKEKVHRTQVTCEECGNPIPSIPSWLSTARVQFECEECRQRQVGKTAFHEAAPLADDMPPVLPDEEFLDEEEMDEEELDIEPAETDAEVEPELAGEPFSE